VATPTEIRKRPRQTRSIALVEAILDACEEALVRDGLGRMSTREVAERAGVSVGSLYQYFPAKEAMVGAVIERRLERDWAAFETLQASYRGEGFEVLLQAVVRALVRLFADGAELYTAMVATMTEVARVAAVQDLVDRATSVLEQHLHAQDDPGLRTRTHAPFLLTTMLVATLRETARTAPERLADPAFADELVHLALRFVEPPVAT